MAFQTVPINVSGPSYQSRSRAVSSQSTINFYQEFDESGKSPGVLHSWPGQKLLGAVTGADRGAHNMGEVLYRVAGSNLYEVSSTGLHTDRGAVLGSERCIFADDGENLFIVNNGSVQQYSSVSQTITSVSDPDIQGSIAVDFLNNQFIYSKRDFFIVSDVGNGASASALNAAQAESQPDDLLRSYVFNQLVYMFGVRSIETWYNSGSGSPPFDRVDTQMIPVGLAAMHSIAHTDNFMYWLGDDKQVYQASTGGAHNRISSKAIAHAIEGYSIVSDAVGWSLTLEGQNFYVLHFPSQNITWAVNESLSDQGWFQLSNDINEGQYNITSYADIYGKNVIADQSNGNLYTLDLDTFTNNGTTIQRTRVLSSFHGGLLNAPGKRVQMSRMELIIEAGVGLITGQGDDPQIMVEASYDGGKSFDGGTWMKIGRLGETNIRAEWFSLKSFYDLIVRITTSDPVHYTIMSGAIDIRLAGR